MYKGNRICVVVPAYNEASQIGIVIDTMPDYVDKIVIVDDYSTDGTGEVVKEYQQKNEKVVLLQHSTNQGCGGSLSTGYKWAAENHIDLAVRMDGDAQMNPENLNALLEPAVQDQADYVKGNRLITGEAYRRMPKIRYYGNAFLSLLTKIASGYWHVADSQSGFTVINRKALQMINWDNMYKRYGQPNDLLVRLNLYNFRVKDVPTDPIYNIGEKSGMQIRKVVFTLSWLLVKLFFWRIKEKYIIRDFHPLVFFYGFGGIFTFLTAILFSRVFWIWYHLGHIPPINALAAMFCFMSASQFILFAMWFDMEANKNLK